MLVDGRAGNGEAAAEIGLDEDADGVDRDRIGSGWDICGRGAARIDAAGGGADTAFPAEGDGARAGANAAFGNGAVGCGGEGGADVLGLDVAATDVVKEAVVGFADDGIDAADIFIAGEGEHVVGKGSGGVPDGEGVGEKDGSFECAEFIELCGPDEFAKGVEDVDGGGNFFLIEIAGVRKDGSDAGADAVTGDDGGVSDADAGDVGDGIVRAGRVGADGDAKVAGAWSRFGSGLLIRNERYEENRCDRKCGDETGGCGHENLRNVVGGLYVRQAVTAKLGNRSLPLSGGVAMKMMAAVVRTAVVVIMLVLCAADLQAQQAGAGVGTGATTAPDMGLKKFVEAMGVTGREGAVAAIVREELKALKPQTDNLGNVWVTTGGGAPHRMLVAAMDEPGYLVSAITADGYLRVQRLPQQPIHGLFDALHSAQPVWVQTRSGKLVSGVVAGLSTHLQGNRRNAPRVDHPDEMYVDIGAATAAEARREGVEVLDAIALERALWPMGFTRVTAAAAVGDRFGVAALVDLAKRIDAGKLRGTLTIGFVAQQWATSRGFDRLTQHVKADEVIYVGRLRRKTAGGQGAGGGAAAAADEGRAQQQPQQPGPTLKEAGSGVLLATAMPGVQLQGFTMEIAKLANDKGISLATQVAAALPRVNYTRGPELPERFAHIGVGTGWPLTPAEFVELNDLKQLGALLEAYVGEAASPAMTVQVVNGAIAEPATPAKPRTAPGHVEILKTLVERYGMSTKEGMVREAVAALLPAWAKPETDEAGNLILKIKQGAPTVAKAKRVVFVAHTDEIGYLVRSVDADGKLVVQSRGGGILQFFLGHGVFVHAASGIRPGVLELPKGWDEAGFEWPRGQQAGPIRVDVGAKSAAEVEGLGIKAGDWVTIPKKYRALAGTRANARSFDDRVGCTSLIAAVWALGRTANGGQAEPKLPIEVTFIWATQEEVGLLGALAAANKMAAAGEAPDYVFAVDTFVSSDSPLESKRFANAEIGKGFVIRAVDNSNIAPVAEVDKLRRLAAANGIPVQFGITGGGNDGATFLRTGTVDVPIAWALRYSHSAAEVIDTRDVDALGRIVAAIARGW